MYNTFLKRNFRTNLFPDSLFPIKSKFLGFILKFLAHKFLKLSYKQIILLAVIKLKAVIILNLTSLFQGIIDMKCVIVVLVCFLIADARHYGRHDVHRRRRHHGVLKLEKRSLQLSK